MEEKDEEEEDPAHQVLFNDGPGVFVMLHGDSGCEIEKLPKVRRWLTANPTTKLSLEVKGWGIEIDIGAHRDDTTGVDGGV